MTTFDQTLKERKQITKLQLIISQNILPNTSEGDVLRKLLFKDFDAIIRNHGIENAIGLVKHHMPELSDKLDDIKEIE